MKNKFVSLWLPWALYDFGAGAFFSIIQTFIFSAYFVKKVSINETLGNVHWGYMVALSSVIVAFINPIVGATTDQGGRRKMWLGLFTSMCIVPTALLWFILPRPEYAPLALVLAGIGILGAESSFLFYNAILPDLAKRSEIGRWSGWGWGMGYAGGLMCLSLSLVMFLSSRDPLIPLDMNTAAPVRATFLLVAVWYLTFSLPLFLWTPLSKVANKPVPRAIKDGFFQLYQTFKDLKEYRGLVKFFIANMLYFDGLATLFAFGGIYAAVTYGMKEEQILYFGITLNIAAGIGAAVFSFLDHKFGARGTIILSLIGLILSSSLAIGAQSSKIFWIFGCFLGLFVGPIQASSRSYLARMAPMRLRHQMFGLSTLSGKGTAFLGPMILSSIVLNTDSLRWGMCTIIAFFVIGLALMLTIEKDKN